MDVWEVLERKHAIRVLLFIQQNPGIIQEDFLKQNTEGQRTKYIRLKELIEIRLIEEKPSERHWNALTYYTTEEGSRIARLLNRMENSEDEETNYGTPSGVRNKMKG